jgi:hypothetical protein
MRTIHRNMLAGAWVCIVGSLLCFFFFFFARESVEKESRMAWHAGTKRPLKAGLKTHSFVAAGAHIKILVGLEPISWSIMRAQITESVCARAKLAHSATAHAAANGAVHHASTYTHLDTIHVRITFYHALAEGAFLRL